MVDRQLFFRWWLQGLTNFVQNAKMTGKLCKQINKKSLLTNVSVLLKLIVSHNQEHYTYYKIRKHCVEEIKNLWCLICKDNLS